MHPNPPTTGLLNFIRLMEDCWNQDPKLRPTFHQVALRLRAMQRWYWAINNARKLTSTTMRLQSLRQNSKSKDEVQPGATSGKQQAQPAAAGSSVVQAGAAMAGGLLAAASAAAGMLGGRTSKAAPPQEQKQKQRSSSSGQQQDAVDGPLEVEAPPPVPDAEDAAAAKAAAPAQSEEPTVQVGAVY